MLHPRSCISLLQRTRGTRGTEYVPGQGAGYGRRGIARTLLHPVSAHPCLWLRPCTIHLQTSFVPALAHADRDERHLL